MVKAITKFLPKSPGQWVIWVLVAVGIVLVYRMIAKEIRLARDRRLSSERLAENQVVSSDLSFSMADYGILADRLAGAFTQWVGYNWSTVESVLKSLKTASDFYKLVQVYGTRDISPASWIKQEFTLIACFEDQLSDGDLKKVSEILKKINVNF